MLDAMEKGSVYVTRSAIRQPYRYQCRKPDKPAEGHGVDYLMARLEYERAMSETYGKRCSSKKAIWRKCREELTNNVWGTPHPPHPTPAHPHTP